LDDARRQDDGSAETSRRSSPRLITAVWVGDMSKDTSGKQSQRTAFFSVEQLADRWGVSSRQVRRWIVSDEFPVHRFGKLIRVSMKDVLVFEAKKASSF
jgi:excisionase family DNA binding protein